MTNWIRCEDRLPELDEDRIWITGVWQAMTKDGLVSESWVVLGYFSSPTLWWDCENVDKYGEPTQMYNPTHWMPCVRPEPPEEERDD